MKTKPKPEVEKPDKVEPFPITFAPANRAVELLAKLANDDLVVEPYRDEAKAVIQEWRGSLATPAQIAMVEFTNDELEVDDNGACVSEGSDNGFFIQTWSWVEYPDLDDWKIAVAAGDTRLGYVEWQAEQDNKLG